MPPAVGAGLVVGQFLRLDAGTVALRFGHDALVTVEGPADVTPRSAMRLNATKGRVTVRVGSETRGFTVETPRAEVVDLGTEFGLEINETGRTDVVVFQGAIDLSYPTRNDPADPRDSTRLTQGEALRLGSGGAVSRIVSVERLGDGGRWSTDAPVRPDAVIERVDDDIPGLGSTKYYQVVPHGLFEDVPAYVDRPHQWNGLDHDGLPEALRARTT